MHFDSNEIDNYIYTYYIYYNIYNMYKKVKKQI